MEILIKKNMFRSVVDGVHRISLGLALTAAMGAMLPISSQAAPLLFNQNVTPDIIFGTGNTNGDFTVDRNNGVELGLRAKIPFVGTINSNGDGTYSYSLAEANPRWNFDWTVNTNFDGSTSRNIDDLTYLLSIDYDPGVGTNFLSFDPITPSSAVPFFDHSIGTNATTNGGGTEAGDAATYASLIAGNNVLQQSWRHAFFTHPTLAYDPTIDGTYDITLTAFDSSGQVASTSIQVIIGAGGAPIPEPATLSLLGLGLAGIGFVRRRKQRIA